MQGETLFREHGKQVAALCWRVRRDLGLEVLLITSRGRKRWILPKGWLEPNMTPAENAAREAFEEAGITGTVTSEPVGSYHYVKERKDGSGTPCQVDVFALAVTGRLVDWPEKNVRGYAWLPIEQAATVISEPGLRQILKDFGKRQIPVKPRRAAG